MGATSSSPTYLASCCLLWCLLLLLRCAVPMRPPLMVQEGSWLIRHLWCGTLPTLQSSCTNTSLYTPRGWSFRSQLCTLLPFNTLSLLFTSNQLYILSMLCAWSPSCTWSPCMSTLLRVEHVYQPEMAHSMAKSVKLYKRPVTSLKRPIVSYKMPVDSYAHFVDGADYGYESRHGEIGPLATTGRYSQFVGKPSRVLFRVAGHDAGHDAGYDAGFKG